MRFYFHVSDIARDTLDCDWRGQEFDTVENALAHAQFLRSDLAREPEFHGYVILTDDDKVKISAFEV
jgi:hypothetical protein